MFKNYDPKLVIVTFRGIQLLGYMDGTFVTAERDEDTFEKTVGATGDVTRVRNRNIAGAVKVTLLAESPTNDLLSAVAEEDRLFGTGYGPLMIKNLNGTQLVLAEIAWCKRPANVEYADTASGREWEFDCAELLVEGGGALV